jgi:type IV pilus assembly protein PilQ
MSTRKSILIFFVLLLFSIPGLSAEETSLSEIVSIDVSDVDGTTEIRIDGSGPFKYTIYKQGDPFQVLVDLQDMSLGKFSETLAVDRAGVLEIIPSHDEENADISRLTIALTVPADVEPVYSANSLILAFDNPDAAGTRNVETSAVRKESGNIIADEEVYEMVEEEVDTIEERYTGEKISIDFQDANLTHVFRLIADISGYNIVVSPDVKGKFSMKLTDVPWDQALDIILRNYTLSKTVEGNIIRVAPTSVLSKEEEEIARAKESQEKAGTLITMVYPINYADVEEIKKSIDTAKILTKRGFISTNARTSSVIIKDVEQKHAEYESLIKALDQPTPQVSIEAKIVEVTRDFQKELGVQWGTSVISSNGKFKMGAGNIPGGTTGLGLSGNPLMVNLPATSVSPGKGGAIAFGFLDGAGNVSLDLQLSAMESAGKGKVLSNPRITTSDNKEAVIMQGKKIPYQTVSQDGTQTEFINAFLELRVTPHITPEGTVVMNLEAKKNDADFAGPQVLGVPTIDIKEVMTQVLIRDNDTLVIGGIFKTTIGNNRDDVPGFADIPLLGNLFKFRKEVDNTNELLIFITPRIVTPPARR